MIFIKYRNVFFDGPFTKRPKPCQWILHKVDEMDSDCIMNGINQYANKTLDERIRLYCHEKNITMSYFEEWCGIEYKICTEKDLPEKYINELNETNFVQIDG